MGKLSAAGSGGFAGRFGSNPHWGTAKDFHTGNKQSRGRKAHSEVMKEGKAGTGRTEKQREKYEKRKRKQMNHH